MPANNCFKDGLITTSDSNSMRAVAIFFIALHNLIHIIHPLKENEFFYTKYWQNLFVDNLLAFSNTLALDVFSYLGWYGVATFLFLSGYGLVRKYECANADKAISFLPFMKYQFLKIFKLMLIPYAAFLLLCIAFGTYPRVLNVVGHLTLLINFWPDDLNPGIYWYLGLCVQLYACYHLFFYKKNGWSLVVLNLLSIILVMVCLYFDWQYPALNFIRHQCIGWFLPFTMGIVFARYNISIVFQSYWKNLLAFVVGVVLLILSGETSYTWFFSSVIAVALALYLCELLKIIVPLNKLLLHIGAMSAFIYVVHPFVRQLSFCYVSTFHWYHYVLYVLVIYLLSFGYQKLHTWLFGNAKATMKLSCRRKRKDVLS